MLYWSKGGDGLKQKWLTLTWPQRVMILIQAFLILLFLILYLALGRQQIITYHNESLRRRTDGEIITYTGKIDGKKAVFTVSGNTVEYRLGDTAYGPYTIVYDSTAVPSKDVLSMRDSVSLVGVEVWEGETRLFRGAYRDTESHTFYLIDSQGEVSYGDEKLYGLLSSGYSGEVYGYTHKTEPGAYSILKLATGSGVEQRGRFGLFLAGAALCIACAFSILYADALFRWNLRFAIRNAEKAEPSDWEIFSRWISWIVLTIVALVWFVIGLTG